jgi:hypothetical protein
MWLIGWILNQSANIKKLLKRKQKIYPEDNQDSKPKEEPGYNPEFKIENIDRYE